MKHFYWVQLEILTQDDALPSLNITFSQPPKKPVMLWVIGFEVSLQNPFKDDVDQVKLFQDLFFYRCKDFQKLRWFQGPYNNDDWEHHDFYDQLIMAEVTQ